MGVQAFIPLGNTVAFTANTAAPTPVQATFPGAASSQYRIHNSSSSIVFLGVGATSSAATNAAVVVSTTAASVPIAPNSVEVLTFVPNAYFTGITSSGNGAVYITPGDGQ
jgi:hypothetical protein